MCCPISSYLIIRPKLPKDSHQRKLPDPEDNSISPLPKQVFNFSKVFPQTSTNEDIFNSISPVFQDCDSGISSTIIIHGDSQSCKTKILNGSAGNPGIMNRSIFQIFRNLGENFSVHLCIFLIFNREIFDMMTDNLETNRFFQYKFTKCSFITKVEVFNAFEVLELIKKANDRTWIRFNYGLPSRIFNMIYDLHIKEKGFDSNRGLKCSRVRFINLMPLPILARNRHCSFDNIPVDAMNVTYIEFVKTINEMVDKVIVPSRNSWPKCLFKDSFHGSKVVILNFIRDFLSDETFRIIKFSSNALQAKILIEPGFERSLTSEKSFKQ